MDANTRQFFRKKFDKHVNLLPEHMVGAMERYLFFNIEPGSFLNSVLCNDLSGAFGRADSINKSRINDIVMFCETVLPANSWGSEENVSRWLSKVGAHWGSEPKDIEGDEPEDIGRNGWKIDGRGDE